MQQLLAIASVVLLAWALKARPAAERSCPALTRQAAPPLARMVRDG